MNNNQINNSNQSRVRSVTSVYSAPLPEASQFEYYERVLTGSADRILVMAERQSKHRQSIEKWAIFGDQIRSFIALLFAFVISIIGGGGGIYLVYLNKEISGLISLFITISSLVGSFIYGFSQKKRDLLKRREEIDSR